VTERLALLTNPRADRVRMVRRLAGRSARRRHGQFLIEGPQAVREALAHIPGQLRDLYLTPEAADRYPELAQRAQSAAGRWHLATREVIDAMSPDAQGVLAVAHLAQRTPQLTELLDTGLLLVLVEASDPGNLGTLIRTADATGTGGVVVGPGSADPLNPKVVRATAGSLFHLPVLTGEPLGDVVAGLREHDWQILAADGAGEWNLAELTEATGPVGTTRPGPQLSRPTAWLLGHEARGLSAEHLAWADATVRVPIYGAAESLNVATAAAVCLYATAWAQRGN